MRAVGTVALTALWSRCKAAFAQKSHGHGAATQGSAGFMSASDKRKLDGIPSQPQSGFLDAHPVGSYFLTSDGANPADAHGGTWVAEPSMGPFAWHRIE